MIVPDDDDDDTTAAGEDTTNRRDDTDDGDDTTYDRRDDTTDFSRRTDGRTDDTTTRVVDCGGLSNPTNGQVKLSGTRVGSTAKYFCNIGFDLVGDNIRKCRSNGQWSGEEPVCKRKYKFIFYTYETHLWL